jgi:hypothetical protein
MTTLDCIASCRQRDIDRMIKRLEIVGIVVNQSDHDLFTLYGEGREGGTYSTLIVAPDGLPAWDLPQLYNLLALIFQYGHPTPYELTLRQVGGMQFKLRIMVPAGADAYTVACHLAAGRQCEIHELIEVK